MDLDVGEFEKRQALIGDRHQPSAVRDEDGRLVGARGVGEKDAPPAVLARRHGSHEQDPAVEEFVIEHAGLDFGAQPGTQQFVSQLDEPLVRRRDDLQHQQQAQTEAGSRRGPDRDEETPGRDPAGPHRDQFVSAGEPVQRQQNPEQQSARDGYGQERRDQLGKGEPHRFGVRALGDDQLDVDDQFVQQQCEQENAGPEEYAGGDEPEDVAAEETHGGPPGL